MEEYIDYYGCSTCGVAIPKQDILDQMWLDAHGEDPSGGFQEDDDD